MLSRKRKLNKICYLLWVADVQIWTPPTELGLLVSMFVTVPSSTKSERAP